MEKIVKIPQYSVEVRFYDNDVLCYDLLLNEIVASKTFKKTIENVQQIGFRSFNILDKKDKIIDEIYIALVEQVHQVATGASYIFDLHMDTPNHGYYVGTYEIGEFCYSEESGLTIKRDYPLDYCFRGCISPLKVFYLGLREINKFPE